MVSRTDDEILSAKLKTLAARERLAAVEALANCRIAPSDCKWSVI